LSEQQAGLCISSSMHKWINAQPDMYEPVMRLVCAELYGMLGEPSHTVLVEKLYRAVDQEVARVLAKKSPDELILCTKGCDTCCHMYVRAADCETRYILDYCRAYNIEIDRAHLERQAQWDEDTFWTVPRNEARCVFLTRDTEKDYGVCRIYEARPTACRLYYVVGPKGTCEHGVIKQVAAKFFAKAEIMSSAALNQGHCTRTEDGFEIGTCPPITSLPAQLLNLLRGEERNFTKTSIVG